MPQRQRMIVIVAPNIGFLEQALPFTYSFKESEPESHIDFFFPKPGTALQLLTGWETVLLTDSIGDSFSFPITRNVWLKVSSATKAGEISKALRYLISGALFLQNRLPPAASNLIDDLAYAVLRSLGLAVTRGIGEPQPAKSVAILDIGVVHKPYFQALNSIALNSDAVSIVHGLDIPEGRSRRNSAIYSWVSLRKDKKLLVCAQAEHEVSHYVESFGVRENEVIVTGIPRHHADWVALMTKKPFGHMSAKRKSTILLISRPGGSPYLPHARKERYITEVSKFASSVGLKILVKLHPREIFGDVYERILGPGKKGSTWDFTDCHVFELHEEVLFAVSFFSGVPLDLLQLGIPTIERLDLRDIPEWDNERADRDAAHQPITKYQKYGLVRGATTDAEFFASAYEILQNTDRVVADLIGNYQKFFLTPPLSAASILWNLNI